MVSLLQVWKACWRIKWSVWPLLPSALLLASTWVEENEDRIDRMIRARDKIKARIFDETGYRKKKSMHQKTFDRLCRRYTHLDWYIDQFLVRALNSMRGFK